MNQFTKIIAAQLKLKEQAVENTLALLEEIGRASCRERV